MLKFVILILLVLIVYFAVRTRKGLSRVDNIFSRENEKTMKEIQAQIQKKLDENKTNKNK